MKNNFISTLSFHKRTANFPVPFPQEQPLKTTVEDPEQSDKKLNSRFERRVNKSDRTMYTTKPSEKVTPSQSQLSSSFRQSDMQKLKSKLQTLQPTRTFSPIKSQRSSPGSAKGMPATNERSSNFRNMQFLPIRSTLKNNIASKSPPTDSNITKEASYSHKNRQRYSPLHELKIENEKLQQENAVLKRQLGQIKKNLLFGHTTKKEEPTSNIRETLKKQNSENFELKLKLELVTKKSIALQGLVESKEEEIQFLKNKLNKGEEELKRCRDDNGFELETLQDKITYVLKSYQDLEIKMTREESDEFLYRSKWQEEKSMYIDRISFLEGYIAHNA